MTSPFSLAGKRALVTAAGQGIGRASVEAFRDAGASVLATDINEATLSGFEGCEILKLDVTDANQVGALAGLEPFDIVFNCAGYVHSGSILDCEEKDWAFAFDLNVTAMYRIIRTLLPAMIANGGGSIINMASVASSILGVPNRFAYGASKAAVIGLSKAVAADFVSQGIRCNVICPGTVHSPSLEKRLAATGDFEKAMAEFTARQPMGRIGDPQEIASLALYLASDAAGFTTGQCHVIDGGWSNS